MTFQVAEVLVSRSLLYEILAKIHRLKYVKETIINGQVCVFAIIFGRNSLKMNLESLSF